MNNKREKSACLPFHKENEKIKMLFMRPSNPLYGGTYLQLPKGTIENGYNPEETIKKELEEEVGLVESNIEHLIFLFKDKLKDCNVYVYAAQVIDTNALQPFHYETSEVKWLYVNDVKHEVRKSQHSIIYKAFGKIIDVFNLK